MDPVADAPGGPPTSQTPIVENPRRILAVSLERDQNQLCQVIKDLTGSVPEPASTTLAGTTHDYRISTPYYTATVPVWLDVMTASPSEWASSFLSEEAKEVLAVLGGVIVVFSTEPDTSDEDTSTTAAQTGGQRTRELLREVGQVVQHGLGGFDWDGVGVAVGVSREGGAQDEASLDEWDELCAEAGLEFIPVQAGKKQTAARNEFGERTGMERLSEALQANDWESMDMPEVVASDFGDWEDPREDKNKLDSGDDDDDDGGEQGDGINFGYDPADLEGMRMSILGLDSQSSAKSRPPSSGTNQQAADGTQAGFDEEDVIQVERMMRQLQAVRDAGEGMGEEQRKRMAARAVQQVMKNL